MMRVWCDPVPFFKMFTNFGSAFIPLSIPFPFGFGRYLGFGATEWAGFQRRHGVSERDGFHRCCEASDLQYIQRHCNRTVIMLSFRTDTCSVSSRQLLSPQVYSGTSNQSRNIFMHRAFPISAK